MADIRDTKRHHINRKQTITTTAQKGMLGTKSGMREEEIHHSFYTELLSTLRAGTIVRQQSSSKLQDQGNSTD